MIRLWYGADEQAARAAWRAAVDAARAVAPAAPSAVVNGEELRAADLAEWLATPAGLFSPAPIIIGADHWLEDGSSCEIVEALLPRLASAPANFLFLEGEAAAVNLILTLAQEVQKFDQPRGRAAGVTSAWSPFPLTNALLARHRKNFWLLLTDALFKRRVAPEDVFWRLWWQVKALWLVATDEAAARRALKPFPFQKTKAALTRYPRADLEILLERLTDCFRADRRGHLPLDLALERFALGL